MSNELLLIVTCLFLYVGVSDLVQTLRQVGTFLLFRICHIACEHRGSHPRKSVRYGANSGQHLVCHNFFNHGYSK